MESKSINRYHTFCKSLKNLQKFHTITQVYYPLFEKFQIQAKNTLPKNTRRSQGSPQGFQTAPRASFIFLPSPTESS